jgi:large subunit ribosomal protein L9
MKVILLRDIPKIGKKYEVKDVSDGYVINFLLPKKLVEVATNKAIAELETLKKKIEIQKETETKLLKENLAKINGLELVLKAKANPQGHLFQSIHKKEIIQKLKKDYQIEIGEEFIALDRPIKTAGEQEIPVLVGKEKAVFKLVIENA